MSTDSDLTLVSALRRLPRGDARGFRFIGRDREERYFPYERLEAEADARAAHLARLGVAKGEKVALVIPEPHEFVLSFLGVAVAGAVPVPIFPSASFRNVEGYVDVLAHIVETSGASLVLCMESNLEIVKKLEGRAACLEQVLTVEEAFAGDAPAFEPPAIHPDDLCFLQFTSGSTSHPKGVTVTHRNLVANCTAFLGPSGLDRREEDIALSWLPLFHDMGLIGFVLGTLICDIQTVLFPTEQFGRSPRLWMDLLSKYGATITYAPNFAYDLVTKRVKEKDLAKLDLSRIRVAGCGAEPIRAQTLERFAEKFAPAGFRKEALLPSYGMAESCLAITFHQVEDPMIVDYVDAAAMKTGRALPTDPDAEGVLEIVSCGTPFDGHELKIVDKEGIALEERRVGQVVSKGPSVTSGYYENPEATAAGWKGEWLQTGDLGYIADGNLYICGRDKDLIIIRGANHYPQDIEWVVADIEGVRRGNVVAFSVMNEGMEALVVVAEGVSRDAERLREEIRTTVSSEFGLVPAYVQVVAVGSLPKTTSGKAQRRKTKALFEENSLEAHD